MKKDFREGIISSKEQIKVAIIFGGCSSEYSVSLESAYSVISHIDREKYIPILIGISSEGEWFKYNGDIEKITSDTWCNSCDCIPVMVSLKKSERSLLVMNNNKIDKIQVDAVFPVLHGKDGEDGTVQGLFELAGIPVVGCRTLSSALCMDKDRAHKLVNVAGIATPISFVFEKNIVEKEALEHAEKIGYPLFVKPVRGGSSCGITKVTNSQDLWAAIKFAFIYDQRVVIEECISGFEVGCAVLESKDGSLIVGEVDEIELSDGFFDFTEKYTLRNSAIHVPARIDEATATKVKKIAKIIFDELDCQGFARVDLFISESGKIVFNEVNTIPGFTAHSRFPNMLKAIGITFEQIISIAIEWAVKE